MKLFLDILFVAILLIGLSTIGAFIGFGFTRLRARLRIEYILNIAKSGKLEHAKNELLETCNMIHELKGVGEIQELYHALESHNSVQVEKAINRIKNEKRYWPKSKMETMIHNKFFWIFIILFFCYFIIYISIKSPTM